jgi:putative tricarboxylic transport membrane protein
MLLRGNTLLTMPSSENNHTHAQGALTWMVDAIVALIMAGIGVVVIVNSVKVGAGWGDDGPRSGYFPFYIGLFILFSSLVNCFLAIRKHRDRSIFVEYRQLRLVLAVLIPSIVYVFAIRYLGIYVASALFIACFMRWQGDFGLLKIVLVSFGVSIALFLMFEVWFNVALPKGPLEAALGF